MAEDLEMNPYRGQEHGAHEEDRAQDPHGPGEMTGNPAESLLDRGAWTHREHLAPILEDRNGFWDGGHDLDQRR